MLKSKERKNRLLMTGGHAATTAAAVIRQIKSEQKPWETFFIGAKYALEGKNVLTLEYELLPKMGVKFFPITTGRIQRRFTLHTIPSILKIPFGFLESLYYIAKIKPDAVLSFGGYASYPVVLSAKILGIPVVLHEQTSAAGRAAIFSAKFADKIALSRKESEEFFPGNKTEITGNPVMPEIASIPQKLKISSPPTLYITGGSRGSQNVNNIVAIALPSLLNKYKIFHQTGELDLQKFLDLKKNLPDKLAKNYEAFSRKDPSEVAGIYKKSDIVIARAGANTVSELMTIKRPAILIPLPISFLDEQTRNANIAKRWGLAEVIPQSDLSPENLIEKIEKISSSYSKIAEELKSKMPPDIDASKKVVALLSNYIK